MGFKLPLSSQNLFAAVRQIPGKTDEVGFYIPSLLLDVNGNPITIENAIPVQSDGVLNFGESFIEEQFSGSKNRTHNFSKPMRGFAIKNDGRTTLSFKINNITIQVLAGEFFKSFFTTSFTQVVVTSNVSYRAFGLQPGVTTAIPSEPEPNPAPAPTAPSNVTNLQSRNVSQTSLTLSWTGSSGATSYNIERNGTFIANVTDTTFNATGLNSNTQYTLIVKAKNSSGVASGTSINVTTLVEQQEPTPAVPNNVTNLTSSDVSDSLFKISWSPSQGATTHIIKINGQNLFEVEGTEQIIDGLSHDTEYVVTVIAKNDAGESTGVSITEKTLKLQSQGDGYLSFDGIDQYAHLPKGLEYDEIELELYLSSDKTEQCFIFAADNLNIRHRSGNTDYIYGGTNCVVKVDDVVAVHSTNFLKDNQKQTINIKYNSIKNTRITLFANFAIGAPTFWTKGRLYTCKVLNQGHLVALYDTSTGHLGDISGNWNDKLILFNNPTFVGVDRVDEPLQTYVKGENDVIFHLDLSGNGGSSNNRILDDVNKVKGDVVNVTHSDTSGWVDNKGLHLPENAYVELKTNALPFRNLVDYTKGLTIETIAYNLIGITYRTNSPDSYKSHNRTVGYRYLSTDGTEKTASGENFYFKSPNGNESNRTFEEVLNPPTETDVFVATYFPNGRVRLMINGWEWLNQHTPPADFVGYTDLFGLSPLFLRRNLVGLNTGTAILKSFSIYNKTLTSQEQIERYREYKQSEPLVGVTVYPSEVQLEPGSSSNLAVVATPSYYTPLLENFFDSSNYGLVDVNSRGVLIGIHQGNTQVSVTSLYGDQEFVNYIPVSVGQDTISPPSSTREVEGIAINRKTEEIEIGESYAAVATTLPYDIFDDNIVVWETSNPEVCTIDFGVIKGVKEGVATITAYDGTKTYSDSFTVSVVQPHVLEVVSEDIYEVDISQFGIRNDGTDSKQTTLGIIQALQHGKTNGSKKTVFPEGSYKVQPDAVDGRNMFYLPDETIVDFNNSDITVAANSKTTTTGYSMFIFKNIKYSKLVKTKIYGENDLFPTLSDLMISNEATMAVVFEPSYKCGLEKCTISKSNGFNIATHTTFQGIHSVNQHPRHTDFVVGDISFDTGGTDDTKTNNYWRTDRFLPITTLTDNYLLGAVLGYFGYPFLRSRLYSIYFYDENYEFMTVHKYNKQYYRYKKPEGVKYAKIVIYQENKPTAGNTDFGGAVAFLVSMETATQDFIRECIIEDNASTGIAMTGGEGFIIEENYFAGNGRRMPACDIDWEDGWESHVGDICRGNIFNSNSGIIVSGVDNIAIYDNTFNTSHLHVWGRTAEWKVYNNFFNGKGGGRNLSLSTQGDSYFARNVLQSVTYGSPTKQHPDANYQVRLVNNILLP